MKEHKQFEPDLAANERAREARLRRLAQRHGLALKKCRVRTPEVVTLYGTYGLVNPENNTWELMNGWQGYGCSLDEIEAYLRNLGKEMTP